MDTFLKSLAVGSLAFLMLAILVEVAGNTLDLAIVWVLILSVTLVTLVIVSFNAICMYRELRRWRNVPFVVIDLFQGREALEKSAIEVLARLARDVRRSNEALLLLQRDGLDSLQATVETDPDIIASQYEFQKENREGMFRANREHFDSMYGKIKLVGVLLGFDLPSEGDWKTFGRPQIPPRQKVS